MEEERNFARGNTMENPALGGQNAEPNFDNMPQMQIGPSSGGAAPPEPTLDNIGIQDSFKNVGPSLSKAGPNQAAINSSL